MFINCLHSHIESFADFLFDLPADAVKDEKLFISRLRISCNLKINNLLVYLFKICFNMADVLMDFLLQYIKHLSIGNTILHHSILSLSAQCRSLSHCTSILFLFICFPNWFRLRSMFGQAGLLSLL